MHMAHVSREISCRFSLAVMSDCYVEKILKAIKSVDVSGIQTCTDMLSTRYVGDAELVLQALETFVRAANDGETHMTLEATFQTEASELNSNNPLELNLSNSNFREQELDKCRASDSSESSSQQPCVSKICFYPLRSEKTKEQLSRMKKIISSNSRIANESELSCDLIGTIESIFQILFDLVNYALTQENQIVITSTISLSSPSLTKIELM